MGPGDDFEEEFTYWSESIQKNAKTFVSRKQKNEVAEIYKQIFEFRKIIDKHLGDIKLNQTEWVKGSKQLTIHKDVTYVFESMLESFYFLSLNLYHPSNHSARCALEHLMFMLYHIGFPVVTESKNFSQAKESVMAFPRYYEFEYSKIRLKSYNKNKRYKLLEFIEDTYSNLSAYVHSSDAFEKDPEGDPIRTIDLFFKGGKYAATLKNIVDTLFIIIVMLCIALKEKIPGVIDDLKKIEIRGINLKDFFEYEPFNNVS